MLQTSRRFRTNMARDSVEATIARYQLPSGKTYFALGATTSPALIWGGFGRTETRFSRT